MKTMDLFLLTNKQRAFVDALAVNQWNGTKAAIAAGYSVKSAHVIACKLLGQTKIKYAIQQLKIQSQNKIDRENTFEGIVTHAKRLAFDTSNRPDVRIKALELLFKCIFIGENICQPKLRQKQRVKNLISTTKMAKQCLGEKVDQDALKWLQGAYKQLMISRK